MNRSALSFIALALLCSCQIQELETPYEADPVGKPEAREVTVEATLADALTETKTELEYADNNFTVYWLPGDKIRIFSAGETSVFTSQNTSPSVTAPFKGTVSFMSGSDENGDPIYAWGIYPARSDQVFNEAEGTIQTTLPSLQPGKAGSFADDLAITMGRSRSLSFSFKSAYSGLRVEFGGEDIVSMTLRGNGGSDALAGRVSLGLDASQNPVVKSVDEPAYEVTMYAPSGQAFEKNKYYYFLTLPGVTVSSGYSVTLRRRDGKEGTFSVNKPRTFERNLFNYVSGLIDQRITEWHDAVTQGPNEIWYTSTEGQVIEYNGTGVLSNEYTGGKGVIRFSAPVTSIANEAFMDQAGLTSVSLPEMVEAIGASAFFGCSSLSSVTMGDQVTLIGDGAFSGCSFETIRLSEGLIRIGNFAFADNTRLRTVDIPESVTNLGGPYVFNCNPFAGCSALESFSGKFASADGLCLTMTSPLYGSNVILASFAPATMAGETYILPDDVTIVAPYAFADAPITGVDLNGTVSIFERAFQYSDLTSVTLPSSVQSLGKYAFDGCENLSFIRIAGNGTSLPAGQARMFDNTGDCPIYVPALWLEVYKGTSPWSDYASRYFVEMPANQILYTATAKIENDFTAGAASNEFSGGVGVLTFADDVTALPTAAFARESALTGITLPMGVESIGVNAFQQCMNLERVTVGAGNDMGTTITSIGNGAFRRCTSLTEIVLPKSLVTLESGAFMECINLSTIDIPGSLVWEAGDYKHNPFARCLSLERFTGKYATDDGLFLVDPEHHQLFSAAIGSPRMDGTICVLPEPSEVGGGITSIAGWAMADLQARTVVFNGNQLERIGYSSFFNTTMIGGLTLPSSVTDIADHAFSKCPNLEAVYIGSDILPTIGSNSFGGEPETNQTYYDPDTDYNIYITGYATYASNSALGSDPWSNYRGAQRVRAKQDNDEIWYHIDGNGNISVGTDLDFGSGGQPVHRTGDSPVFYLSSYDAVPCVEMPVDIFTDSQAAIGVLVFDGNVTGVPDSAFENCSYLDYVSLPPVIESIGASAFRGTSLKVFPLSNYAYNVKSIGDFAFANCAQMVFEKNGDTVLMPALTSLGSHAFEGCQAFGSDAGLYTESKIVLGKVSSIPNYAFSSCQKLTGVLFYDGLSAQNATERISLVGGQAFYNCENLVQIYDYDPDAVAPARIDLPGVTDIAFSAFKGCSSITDVTLGKVGTISQFAFEDCGNLVSVTLDTEDLTNVEKKAFNLCTSLVKVGDADIPSGVNLPSVTTVGQEAFSNTAIDGTSLPSATALGVSAFSGCPSLGTVNLPNLAVIPMNCFYNDGALYYINAPMVESIGNYAFYKCSSLVTFNANNVVPAQTIGSNAFYKCTSLVSLDLSGAVTLGESAFSGCSKLAAVTITNVQTLGANCFAGLHKLEELKMPNIRSIGAGALGNGTKLSTVGIGPSIESLSNSLFCTFAPRQLTPGSIEFVMSRRDPPEISADTFAKLVDAEIPFTLRFKNSTIADAYVSAWRSVYPFSSLTPAQLSAIFVY